MIRRTIVTVCALAASTAVFASPSCCERRRPCAPCYEHAPNPTIVLAQFYDRPARPPNGTYIYRDKGGQLYGIPCYNCQGKGGYGASPHGDPRDERDYRRERDQRRYNDRDRGN